MSINYEYNLESQLEKEKQLIINIANFNEFDKKLFSNL